MIRLVVNGKSRELDRSLDLASYLESYGLNLKHVAVGYNGTVLDKEKYPEVHLKEGDVLEIVKPAGGG